MIIRHNLRCLIVIINAKCININYDRILLLTKEENGWSIFTRCSKISRHKIGNVVIHSWKAKGFRKINI